MKHGVDICGVLSVRFARLAFWTTLGSAFFAALLWCCLSVVVSDGASVSDALSAAPLMLVLIVWGAVWLLQVTLPIATAVWIVAYSLARRAGQASHAAARLSSMMAAIAALAGLAALGSGRSLGQKLDQFEGLMVALGPGVLAATVLASWCLYPAPRDVQSRESRMDGV